MIKETKTEDERPVVVRGSQTARPSQKRNSKIAALLVFVALFALLGGILGGYMVARFQPNSSSSLSVAPGGDGNKIVTQQEQDIAGIASKVGPSVVSVLTQGVAQSYFGGTSAVAGAGTGIIVSSDGYILTNKHVIQDSQTVSVVTADGNTYKNVKVVGTDPLNDVAFLKIDGASGLKPAELGDSKSIRIGQNVVAIGNALGQYDNSVTSGIVSGIGRSITASLEGSQQSQGENLTDLIQIDAAINSGNSGGPLVNAAGQVIGINTALASDANSIGFSIPIGAVKGMLKGVLQNGKVERAYVGVNYVAITPAVAQQYNLSAKKGAYVLSSQGTSAVVSGSPADKAGLKEKDIITKVGDAEVGVNGSVSTLIAEYQSGETVPLTVLRDGNTQTVNVTLATYNG